MKIKTLLIAGLLSLSFGVIPTYADTVYTTDYVNVRREPSLDGEKVGTLKPNTKLDRVAEGDGEWDIIEIEETEYYICNDYITTTEPEEIIEIESIEPILLGYYKLTAYCNCTKCCGKNGGVVTRSGTTPTVGRTVACNSIDAGTQVMINDHVYTVEDTGNMKDNVIDIYMESHSVALDFGVKHDVPVYLVK